MIKLIATDLDGTLFYPTRKIKLLIKKNRLFLQKFIEAGNKVVLVSGRNFQIADRLAKKLKNSVDMIACNGSIVYQNGEIVKDYPMNHDDIYKLYLDNLNNKRIVSWIFMTDKHNMILVPNKMNFFMTICYRVGMFFQFRYRGKYCFGKKHFLKMIKDENVKIYKVMCVYGLGMNAIKKARVGLEEMTEKYGDKFEIFQSHVSLEFMNKGVNKANCLLDYISENNVDKEEVAVVGDSGNDVPLFETFPNSFVMAQALEEVKEKAKQEIEAFYHIKKFL